MSKHRDIFLLLGICSFVLLLFYIAQKQVTESIPSSVYILAPADVQELSQSSVPAAPIFSVGADNSFFSSIIESVVVSPKIAQTGAVSRYDVEYLSQKSLYPGGSITVQFPFDFGFADACSVVLATPENVDLNGFSPGQPAIDAITCDSFMKTAKIRTKNDPIRQGDTVRFLLDGVVNSNTALSYSSLGYTASIQTQDHAGNYLESLISLPFFLEQAGTQTISGTVFKDDGAGALGTPADDIKNGDEAGILGAQVCLGGSAGYQCQTTPTTGVYRFEKLGNGYYSIDVQPFTSGNLVGGPFFQAIELQNGANRSGVDFGFTSPDRTITVRISNIPVNTDIDVFAFSSESADGGGYVLRELSWDGNSSRSIDLPVSDGFWEIGVGPALSKDPLAANTAVFEFSFIPPKSKQVFVSGAAEYSLEFALQSSDRQIKGKVINGSGIGIPNVFVNARPAVLTDEAGKETSTQSRADGSFTLKVAEGVYSVNAYVVGLPPAGARDVTVKTDTDAGTLDGNATADISSDGVRITNDGDGGKDNLLFKINTRDRSITGRVLDELSQPIAYAFVSAEAVNTLGGPIGDWSDSPTDTTGKFTLLVNNGTWKIRAFDPRYGEVGTKIAVVNGTNLTGQDIQSPPTFGTVTGSVKKNNKAAAGAFVTVYGPNGSNGTVTDKNGEYSLKVKQGNKYTIEGFLPGVGSTSVITDFSVAAGSTTSSKNLVIETPGTIVVAIPGVSDAYVDAFDASGRGNGTSANPIPGTYTLTIPPGTYTVAANSIDYGVLGEKGGIVVTGGSTTTVAFTPPRSFTVSGKIISSSDICKNGAFVSLSDTQGGRMVVKTTDASGMYSISVPNGAYLISASKPGCIEKGEPATIVVRGVDVSSGADRTLTVPASSIAGRVLLSTNNTTLETVITAESSDGRAVSTTVDTTKSSGNNYTLNLAQGIWNIGARSDGYESVKKTVTLASGDNQTFHLTLSPIAGFVKTERVYTSVKPSQGGVVKDSNVGDDFALKIPAGALGSSVNSGSVGTKVTTAVVEKTATAQVVGGKGIEITPKDSSGKPITTLSSSGSVGVTVTVPYNESDVADLGIDESKLVLATWSAEKMQWEPLATTVNTEKNTLTASAKHFSVFAPIVPAEKVATPQVVAASQAVAPSSPSTIVQTAPLGTALPPQSTKSLGAAPLPPKSISEPIKQTPIEPSSRSERVTSVIETRGGVISVSVPPQAVSLPSTLSVVPIQATDIDFAAPFVQGISSVGNMVYDITLHSEGGGLITEFNEPVSITLSYAADQVAHLQEDTLAIQYWDRDVGKWASLADGVINKVTHTVTATTRHFTLFAVTGAVKKVQKEFIDPETLDADQRVDRVMAAPMLPAVKQPLTKTVDVKQKKQQAPRKVVQLAEVKKITVTDTQQESKPSSAKDSVKSPPVLFDVFVSVPQNYKQIVKGQSVVAQVKIDSGGSTQHDIAVRYSIKDSKDAVIVEEKERIAFQGKTALVKSFVMPSGYGQGEYYVVVSLPEYDTEASAEFQIQSEMGTLDIAVEPSGKIDYTKSPLLPAAAGIIALLILGAIVRLRKKK